VLPPTGDAALNLASVLRTFCLSLTREQRRTAAA
jgi:hypothetical protein